MLPVHPQPFFQEKLAPFQVASHFLLSPTSWPVTIGCPIDQLEMEGAIQEAGLRMSKWLGIQLQWPQRCFFVIVPFISHPGSKDIEETSPSGVTEVRLLLPCNGPPPAPQW